MALMDSSQAAFDWLRCRKGIYPDYASYSL